MVWILQGSIVGGSMIYGTASFCILLAFLLVGVGIGLYLMFIKKDDKTTTERH
jgi:hypothetical protein